MTRIAPLASSLALLAGTVACAPAFRPPSVDVMSVAVASLGFTGGTAEVELRLGNPNRAEIRLDRVEYGLEVGEPGREGRWELLAQGASSPTVTLPGRDTISVTLDVPFRYGGVGAVVRSLLRRGEVGYRLRGRVRARGPLGRIVRPFEARGTVGPR